MLRIVVLNEIVILPFLDYLLQLKYNVGRYVETTFE